MYNLSYRKGIVKKLFLLSLIFFQLTDVRSQTSRYGITVGGGSTSLNKIPNSIEDRSRYSSISSYWGGLTAELPLGNSGFSIYGSALYNKRGYDYSIQNQSGINNTAKDSSFSQRLNYIDLNFNLLKRFPITEKANFFIGTGPSVNIFMSGTEHTSMTYLGNSNPAEKTKSNLVVGNIPGAYKRVFLSLNSVAGFEFNKFSIWVNYNSPLDYYYLDAKKKLQHKINSFGVNVAYALFPITHTDREKREKKEKPAPPTTIAKDTTTDSDGDGIPDIHDKCPGHKGTAKYGGCPIPDSDGDGINDDEDKCPLLEGSAANNGCPKFIDTPKPVSKDTLHFIVYFEPGKSNLRTEAFNTLSEIVRLLKANSKLHVIFNGHTDNVGSVEANSIRSFGRALVCADYVASFFISRDRLVVAAYGNKLPVADLNDALLQWKNRRVEILVFEQND